MGLLRGVSRAQRCCSQERAQGSRDRRTLRRARGLALGSDVLSSRSCRTQRRSPFHVRASPSPHSDSRAAVSGRLCGLTDPVSRGAAADLPVVRRLWRKWAFPGGQSSWLWGALGGHVFSAPLCSWRSDFTAHHGT